LIYIDPGPSEFPGNRKIGIGPIGAEGPRLDASREEVSKHGFTLGDGSQCRLDRLRDALPGSLRS
jgi:hypothetical protein